ncbi:hypothetical protein BC826DRAFT_1108867 [Russula brevipes]|nr:hypothetical protein BC826DRAFT_1108867 [Russula brevipes]
MSTTPISPSQRLRIAIGLAALKYKPSQLSIQCLCLLVSIPDAELRHRLIAYVLELKYYFCRSPTISLSEECDVWRKRALQLEAELHATRAGATPEDFQLLVTQSALASAGDATQQTLPSYKRKGRPRLPPQPSKAKSRTLKIPSTSTARPALCDAVPSGKQQPTTSLWTHHSLFSSLQTFDTITAPISTRSSSPPDAVTVAAATIRCIEVLHTLLMRAISPTPVAHEDATPQEVLDGMGRILPHILRTAVRTLNRAYIDPSSAARLQWHADPVGDEKTHSNDTTSALELVLGRLTTRLLVPAIRALVPCTLSKTEHILSAPQLEPRKRAFADGTQLLDLIAAVLNALPDPQHIALHDHVALETIRALTSLIMDRPLRVPHAQLTPTQRIHRIARKDALYFLCDAALLALRRSAHVPQGHPEDMLRTALEEALGSLALTQSAGEGGTGLHIVEEHRVMVVLERAWSVGLRVGNIGGDMDGTEMDVSHGDVHGQDGDVPMMMNDLARAD